MQGGSGSSLTAISGSRNNWRLVHIPKSLWLTREKRNDARKLLRDGIGPGALRRQQAQAKKQPGETFEEITTE